MSSKSRHDRKSQNEAHAPIEHVDGGIADAPSVEDFLGENTIHVPEGKNPIQFIFLIGLLIFLLIIFIIPGAFQNSIAGGGGDDDAALVTWETPAGPFSMNRADFMVELRAEAASKKLQGGRKTPSHEEIATILLMDALAIEAGVVASDAMVLDFIRSVSQSVGGQNNYKQLMAREFSGGARTFERIVRRNLRINLYELLLARVAVAPSADNLEVTWHEQHEDFAYGFIATDAALYKDAALADVLDDEALEAWFGERPEWERSVFKTKEKWSFGSAFFTITDPAPTALLERFPMAEDWDLEAEASRFYQTYSYLIFKREEEVTDEDGGVSKFFPQAEVQTQAEAGAMVHASLKAWHADLEARMIAGDIVDVAAEAQELGLGWHESTEAMSRVEILDDNGFGGGMLSTQIQSTEPDQLVPAVMVDNDIIQVVKVLSNVEPTVPDFAEIRDEIADKWAEEHSGELAVETLAALTEADSLTDEEFQALIEGNEALTFGVRDWLDSGGNFSDDPNSELPGNQFIAGMRGRLGLEDLEEGGLAEATLAFDRSAAYIVRSMGSRPVPFGNANPGQLQTLEMSAEYAARSQLRRAYSSQEGVLSEYLVDKYGLRLPAAEKQAAEKAKEEADAAAAEEAGEEAGEEAPTDPVSAE